jgi:hypothetical protein
MVGFAIVAVAASVTGLALGWALRGPARWCPACGATLSCRDCRAGGASVAGPVGPTRSNPAASTVDRERLEGAADDEH